VALFAAVFAAAAGTHALTPLFPEIKAALGVGDGAARSLTSVFTLGYSVSGLLLGPLCDRIGRRRVLLPALLGYAVASALLLAPLGYASVCVLRLIAGVCTGGVLAAVIAVTSDTVAYEKRGRAMTFVLSGTFLAVIIGMPLASTLAHVRLTAVFGLLALVAAASLLALRVRVPADVRSDAGPAGLLQLAVRAMRARGAVCALLTTFLNTAAAFMLMTSFADHVADRFGATLDHRSLLFLALGIAGIPGVLFAGLFSDAFGKRRLVIAALFGSAVLTPLLLVPQGFLAFCLVAAPVALVQSLRMGPFTALLAELVPDDLRGSLVGLNSAASGIGIAAGTWLAGLAYESFALPGVVGATVLALTGSLLAFRFGVVEPGSERSEGSSNGA